MYCDQCGTPNRDQAKFCVKCGARISEPETNNTSNSSTYENIKSTNNVVSPQLQYQNTNCLSQYKTPKQSSPCLYSVGDYISQKEEIESKKAKQENLTLWQVIKLLNKLDGRITRSSAWKVIGTYILVLIVFYIIYNILNSVELWSDLKVLCLLIAVPTYAYIWVTFCITLFVQRLHDIGLSGFIWWLLIPPVSYLLKQWGILFSTINEYSFLMDKNQISDIQESMCNYRVMIGILLIIILIIYCIPGNEEPNDYGSTRK